MTQKRKPKDGLQDKRQLFAMVETAVLRNPAITPQVKVLYALLITYGPDKIFPGHERLAADLGVADRSIRRWLLELKDWGLSSHGTEQVGQILMMRVFTMLIRQSQTSRVTFTSWRVAATTG